MAVLIATLVAPTADARAGINVAVLYFDNNTGDAKYDVLNKGLADMIITDLSGVEGLTLVERSRLEDIVGEQKLQRSKLFDTKTSVKVGKLLGARYAVTGAIAAISPQMRLDIRLIDVETAQVVLADKVVGKADQFFEMEKTLVARFAKGLNKAVPKAIQRADSLGTVLDYAQGLDMADKGDFKGASQRLARLVSSVPQFQLAKTRYEEFLRRLYASKNKRHSTLGAAAQGLLDVCDAILGTRATAKKGKKLKSHLTYRVLRGNLVLGYLAKLIGAKNPIFAVKPTPQQLPQAKEMVRGWSANQGALIAELVTARKKGLRKSYSLLTSIDNEQVKLAKELGAGHSPAKQAFLSVQSASRAHAKFLCQGKSQFASSVAMAISPTPAEMNAGNGWYAIFLLEFAIDDILTHEANREREHIRALEEYGDCLLALERKTDAIAKWQSILETYPKTQQFPKIERKIKKALGVK